METMAVNFFINAALTGWPVQEKNRKKYGCNIPPPGRNDKYGVQLLLIWYGSLYQLISTINMYILKIIV